MNLSFSCCGGGNEPLDALISQDQIGAVYDRLAPIYDVWGRLTESRARRRAIALARIQDGQNILEVAVGTGLAFEQIVKQNPHGRNTGIDLSCGMLARAKKRLQKTGQAHYVLAPGTAFHLPAHAESVDLLFNNYMFDLLACEEMDRALVEFKRALKPGGKLILINMTQGETAASRLYDRVYRLSPRAMGGCRGVQLAARLKQHGFAVETREYHQQLLFPSEVILAHKPA
jgi:ubiquinone/menaquinone biosynthesis C-methylase UbiE